MLYSSPAKINLSLHITGKRDDGFHNLQSLVAFTDFADEIFIEQSDVHLLIFQGEFATGIDLQNNSLTRTLQVLEHYTARPLPCSVRVIKNIPSGAGLGGGSSNAATLFHALIDFYDLEIPRDDLAIMAASIGSDVPACLYATPLLMSGRGEICSPAPSFPTLPVILIKPEFHHPTIDIYKNLSMPIFSEAVEYPDFFDTGNELCRFLKTHTRNDLENPAFKLSPDLKTMLKFLESQKNCLLARMTGSGSALCAVFDDDESAHNTLNAAQKKYPSLWGIHTYLIGG